MKNQVIIKQTKGAVTKASILNKARIVYNEHGLNLKIDEIVKLIGCNKSNLTNHFPNKEKLIEAIAIQYDEELTKLALEHNYGKYVSIEEGVQFFNLLMDIQYEFRSAILYTINSFFNGKDFKKHISKSYNSKLKMFVGQLELLNKNGFISDDLFENENLDIFITQYFTASIHWLSFYEMYDIKFPFKSKKEKYLKSIFNLYLPYLTKKGRIAFDKINFKAIVAGK